MKIDQRLRCESNEMSMQSREALHNFSIINAPEIPDNTNQTEASELNYATSAAALWSFKTKVNLAINHVQWLMNYFDSFHNHFCCSIKLSINNLELVWRRFSVARRGAIKIAFGIFLIFEIWWCNQRSAILINMLDAAVLSWGRYDSEIIFNFIYWMNFILAIWEIRSFI